MPAALATSWAISDQAVLPPNLHTTQLVLLKARFYQLTGLIKLLQTHEAQLKQAKSDKQHLLQQTAQSVAELKPLPSAVAELMQPIAQYVKPREFDYRTSYEYGRYDQQYQKLGDYQPQCNLVEDMACALHGELKSIYGEASSFMEKLGDLNEKLLRFQLRYGQ